MENEKKISAPGIIQLTKDEKNSEGGCYDNGCFHGCIDSCECIQSCDRAPDPHQEKPAVKKE